MIKEIVRCCAGSRPYLDALLGKFEQFVCTIFHRKSVKESSYPREVEEKSGRSEMIMK